MGGQACVLYGAAEFSRDTDLALLASPDNLTHLQAALDALGASVIAVPSLELKYLERGHAVHFAHDDPAGGRTRIDVMARMRNVDPFPALWARRTTVTLEGVGDVELLSLPDLALSKKTQRDRDWPMLRRLVEVNYLTFRSEATEVRVEFWLRELRTPALLLEAAARFGERARALAASRPLLAAALRAEEDGVTQGLAREEEVERAADRAYWAPLRA
ncbi:MAG: hypothetical protein HYW06_14280, partial [Gemmatimonadetes bacterium]|nr:hypothetical protein [Gemmatimonadota bacterium]